jgi:hypothetical protein
MNELYYGLAIAPLTLAMVQAIKQTGYLADRFAALVSMLVAVVLTVLASVTFGGGFDNTSILLGITFGLAASGLYSGGAALKNG